MIKMMQQLQTQCVAISEDGINFKKLENNPIINIDSFPEDLNILRNILETLKFGNIMICIIK